MRKIVYYLCLAQIIVLFSSNYQGITGVGSVMALSGYVLVIFWVMHKVTSGGIRKPPFFLFMTFTFFLWSVCTSFWSNDVEVTLRNNWAFFRYSVIMIVFWDSIKSCDELMGLLKAFCFGIIISVINLLYSVGQGQTFGSSLQYSSGDFDPNYLGVILGMSLPVFYFLYRSCKNRLFIIIIPLIIIGIFFTGSRTAVICAFVGLLYPFYHSQLKSKSNNQEKVLWISVAGFLIAIVFFGYLEEIIAFIPPVERISSLWTGDSSVLSLGGRLTIWEDGWQGFWDSPLIGNGSGTFRSAYSTVTINQVAHNTFLSVVVETGLIGLIIFCLAYFSAFFVLFFNAKGSLFHITFFWVLLILTIGISVLTWEVRPYMWIILLMAIIGAEATKISSSK